VVTEAGMDSVQLAQALGVTSATVRRWWVGQEPKASTLAAIERCLGVPLGTILCGAGLIELDTDTRTMLRSDSQLTDSFRRVAAVTYDVWVQLSEEERHSQ